MKMYEKMTVENISCSVSTKIVADPVGRASNWTTEAGQIEATGDLDWHSSIHLISTFLFFVCLCWGFTTQSAQWGHLECNQFT